MVDEYTVVIQEFFQKRVEAWLETVGKKIFRIKHYWGRFEFTPARGQIHLHLLAISDDPSFNVTMHKLDGNTAAQASFTEMWSKGHFGYTAEVDHDVFDNYDMSHKDNPCRERYSEVDDKKEDAERLKKFVQEHVCSDYCLRTHKNAKGPDKKKRTCRSGAGTEKTEGKADTPGFEVRDVSTIVRDSRGFRKVLLKRNHQRVVQTSTDMVQSWRGNCDVQIMLYDCDPTAPDPMEIAKVTDYVVSYACKGNVTLAEEKRQIKQMIMMSRESDETSNEVTRLARHLLNRAATNRTISKQECMVQLMNLNLVICTETIETVSISGSYRVQDGEQKTVLKKYLNKHYSQNHLSLHKFFMATKNPPGKVGKKIIPHYVGGQSQPRYPVTEGYARATFIIHRPWSKEVDAFDKSKSCIPDFKRFVEQSDCPAEVEIPYKRMLWRYLSCTEFREPTGKDMEQNPLDGVDDDIVDLLDIGATLYAPDDIDDFEQHHFEKGEDFDWTVRSQEVSTTIFVLDKKYAFFLTIFQSNY